MGDVALVAGGVQAAPLEYVIPGAQEIVPKATTAAFDGSAAAGDFVPTLQVIAPNGAVLASCPVTDAVVAGASADVSWFPRGGVSKAPAPPSDEGIQFTAHGVYGAVNTGDALNVNTTTGGGANFNTGLGNFFIQAGGGTTLAIFSPVISMQAGSASFGIGTSSPPIPAAGNDIDAGAANFRITLGTGGDGFKIIKKASPHNPIFRVRNEGGANSLNFYNQAGNPILTAAIVAGPLDAIGVFGSLAAKQTVVGSRGGNAALASFLTAMANYGWIIDNSTP